MSNDFIFMLKDKIKMLEKQNSELQERNTELVLENRKLKEYINKFVLNFKMLFHYQLMKE